jgi:hypothetical protein
MTEIAGFRIASAAAPWPTGWQRNCAAQFPGGQILIRITPADIFPNCPRNISNAGSIRSTPRGQCSNWLSPSTISRNWFLPRRADRAWIAVAAGEDRSISMRGFVRIPRSAGGECMIKIASLTF